jgi:hypothetical protein
MAQWGNTDDAANSVSWVAQSLGEGSGKSNQAANNTALYANSTADAFITGQTVGQFGISVGEAAANPVAHAGWVLRREGSGGRAGRVTYETLVAGSFITSDGDTLPNYVLTFTTQPSNDSANVTASETATFGVVVASNPSGASVTYKWQANTGSGFANVNNGAVYGNTTTATLTVLNVTGLNGAQYRVLVSANNATNTSSAGVLTVTT